jgi:hypothetical protein
VAVSVARGDVAAWQRCIQNCLHPRIPWWRLWGGGSPDECVRNCPVPLVFWPPTGEP